MFLVLVGEPRLARDGGRERRLLHEERRDALAQREGMHVAEESRSSSSRGEKPVSSWISRAAVCSGLSLFSMRPVRICQKPPRSSVRRKRSTRPSSRCRVTLTVPSSGSASETSLSQTSPASSAKASSTSWSEGVSSVTSDSSEATPAPWMPQGTMAAKSSRFVCTLKANPCEVIQREMCTPMAPSLPAAVQTPVRPATRAADTPYSAATRIISSSTEDTYLRTSLRSGFRSRMG